MPLFSDWSKDSASKIFGKKLWRDSVYVVMNFFLRYTLLFIVLTMVVLYSSLLVPIFEERAVTQFEFEGNRVQK